MMTGLLLHSVDKKPKLNMSSYSVDKFGRLLDIIKVRNIGTITVSQQDFLSSPTSSPISISPPTAQGAINRAPTQSTISSPTSSSPPITTAITFDDGLQSFYDNAYPLLEDKGIKSTVFAIAGTVGKSGGWDIMGKTQHIDANTLREIASKGHEIGSHSLTHANLVWLDDKELMKELRNSRIILEDITGKPVKSLSFPFGSWNKRVWNAAKSAGYEYATAYRGHKRVDAGILPVLGVYRFDSAEDAVDRIMPEAASSFLSSLLSTRTLALTMSHFSKGTPICKFRKQYRKKFPG
jgi:hypothetical protein